MRKDVRLRFYKWALDRYQLPNAWTVPGLCNQLANFLDKEMPEIDLQIDCPELWLQKLETALNYWRLRNDYGLKMRIQALENAIKLCTT